MKNLFYLIFALFMFTSCDKTEGSGKICASTAGGKLKITNHSEVPVHYFVLERDFAATANWAKTCTDQNKITAGSSAEISFANLSGYKTDAEVLVYWWTDCSTQDNVKTLLISTKGSNNTCSP